MEESSPRCNGTAVGQYLKIKSSQKQTDLVQVIYSPAKSIPETIDSR